jgi:hypothetical protein
VVNTEPIWLGFYVSDLIVLGIVGMIAAATMYLALRRKA